MEESLLSRKKLIFNQGSNYFRQRLILSLLSAKPVQITEIRSKSDFAVGVADFEVSFIGLLDKLSNGSRSKISETGTEVNLIPGTLLGGSVVHVCHESRPLSYYLEPILLLAPFCKKPLNLTLKGRIQNDATGYNSIYKLKHAALPIMEMFGLEVDLQVKFRSFEESEVVFTSTVKKQLLTLRNQLNQDCGKVKKIRGLTYGFRISPQMLNRVIASAKGIFLPFINDVFITNDPVKNSKSKLPGYGIILYAETTKGIHYASDGFLGKEKNSDPNQISSVTMRDLNKIEQGRKRDFDLFPDDNNEKGPKAKKTKLGANIENNHISENSESYKIPTNPEELGVDVAKQLLREISTQSRVDSVFQWLVIGFMALGPKDVTSVVLGNLTPFTVQFLRDLKSFFGVTFKVENYTDGNQNRNDDDDEDDDVKVRKLQLYKLSCLGSGYINLNKTMV